MKNSTERKSKTKNMEIIGETTGVNFIGQPSMPDLVTMDVKIKEMNTTSSSRPHGLEEKTYVNINIVL